MKKYHVVYVLRCDINEDIVYTIVESDCQEVELANRILERLTFNKFIIASVDPQRYETESTVIIRTDEIIQVVVKED